MQNAPRLLAKRKRGGEVIWGKEKDQRKRGLQKRVPRRSQKGREKLVLSAEKAGGRERRDRGTAEFESAAGNEGGKS